MKKIFTAITVMLILTAMIDVSQVSLVNPKRNQTNTLTANILTAHDSGSKDRDNITGASSFTIANAGLSKIQTSHFVKDDWEIKEKFTDSVSLFSNKLPVKINLSPLSSCDSNRPHVNAQLVYFGKLSKPRMQIAVAAAGTKILFAGGNGAPDCPDCWGSSRVDIYDTVSHQWSTAELSQGRWGMTAVTAGNKIFFAGGEFGDGAFDYIYSAVDIYDASTNTWSVASLSESRSYIAAATVGNKVFFAGGWQSDTHYVPPTDKVDIYDLSTNTWSTVLLSEARGYASAITNGQKIYFAGGLKYNGSNGGIPSDRIDIYDNASQSWSTATLTTPMELPAGIRATGKIYWASGCDVEIKDSITGISTTANLFKSGSWLDADGQNAVIKDSIIIFFRHQDPTDKFDIYNTASNTWKIGVLPQNPISYSSIISVNNEVFVAGGASMTNTIDTVWKLKFNCFNATYSALTVTDCKNYTLNNITYTSSGVYTQTITNTAGCDSIITLNLTVSSITASINAASCSPYTWHNHTYYTSGLYSDTLVTANGCDSIVTLNLVINTITASINAASCGPYTWHNHTYNTSGVYSDTLVAANGCDSIITLQLTINPGLSSTLNKSICAGQSYNGHTTAGNYVDTLTTVSGCDSIVAVQLTVLPKPAPYLGADTSICNGQSIQLYPGQFNSYTWQDGSAQSNFTVKQAGAYSVTVTNGCGSANAAIVINEGICGIYFPGAFTPNHDGKNDLFKILGAQNINNYSLEIYNRYGEKIFETNDPATGWDGTYKGKPQNNAAYTWKCIFTNAGTKTQMKGTVILLR
ncbi:MAG: T9SS type B sorting domain-containing protein [Ferruginibacter sp.]